MAKEPRRATQRRKSRSLSPPLKNNEDEEGVATRSDTNDEGDDADIDQSEDKNNDQNRPHSRKTSNKMTDDDEDEDNSADRGNKRSIKVKHSKGTIRKASSPLPPSTPKQNSHPGIYIVVAVAVVGCLFFYSQNSTSDSQSDDWRSRVDPRDVLSDHQQSIVRASMKSIMQKSSSEEGVSTLLILSPEEEDAAKLARCLLRLTNTETHQAQIPTEIDLRSHRGGKVQLDSNLRSLLSPGGTIRAVLLRHIDDNSSTGAFERARLLFAYCDGENPVIPHRLIIMTATSKSGSENELRETFKARWPKEHDFVDALMSRISGHTLFVDEDQKSIC